MSVEIPNEMIGVIGGLKKTISNQTFKKNIAENEARHNEIYLMKTWKMMKQSGFNSFKLKKLIWEYATSDKYNKLYKKMESKNLGIFTTIGDYTNKAGHTSKAHFTENKHYYGSVGKLGKEPVSYMGQFEITPDRFEIDLKKLNDNMFKIDSPDGWITSISDLFVLKPPQVECEEIFEDLTDDE